MRLAPGTRLGPYEVLGSLGAGGMGEVYRARDPRLARDVAVKVISGSAASDPDRIRRLQLEAQATAALNHPNILAVYDVGTADGLTYVDSWVEVTFNRCFQLMECDDASLLQEWVLQWSEFDFGTFEIVPVVTSRQTRDLVERYLPPLPDDTELP